MAPNSSDAAPAAEGFFERVLLLPALSDAIALVSHAYKTTQDRHQYVGTALRAAEVGIRVATDGALPLAKPLLHPLVNRVGGWGALEEWACRGLDRVEEAAPIITKPTDEVDVITTSRGGRLAAGAADRVLNTAHTLVDAYLPAREGDLHDTDGRDATVGVKAIALASKMRRRMERALHSLAHPHHAHADECDARDASGSFLVAYSRECVLGWHSELARQPEPFESVPGILRIARIFYMYLRNVTEYVGPLLQSSVVAVRKSLAGNAVGEALSGVAANGSYVVSEVRAWGEYFIIVVSMTPTMIEEASLRSKIWAEGCLESVKKRK
ncbi:lipid storage droplet protein [Penaeus vannamei]|uniref:Lipid storage droplet protein n=1 Tax=Penaeus vannamei TaxID=6689 RepID=A0A423SZ97_PENVA|nr:lipid storage droplet protein [Penaeus vannamei]